MNTKQMNTKNMASCLLAASLALSGCAASQGPQEQTGVIIGGVLGGVLGHEIGRGHGRTAATIIGSLIGASVGGSIGRSMDETDRLVVAHSLETVRTGVPTSWKNPDTQGQYVITPTRTYDASTGPCREYTLEALIGGNTETIYGTACRQADGSWKIVK